MRWLIKPYKQIAEMLNQCKYSVSLFKQLFKKTAKNEQKC
jgi:hypothetical protein